MKSLQFIAYGVIFVLLSALIGGLLIMTRLKHHGRRSLIWKAVGKNLGVQPVITESGSHAQFEHMGCVVNLRLNPQMVASISDQQVMGFECIGLNFPSWFECEEQNQSLSVRCGVLDFSADPHEVLHALLAGNVSAMSVFGESKIVLHDGRATLELIYDSQKSASFVGTEVKRVLNGLHALCEHLSANQDEAVLTLFVNSTNPLMYTMLMAQPLIRERLKTRDGFATLVARAGAATIAMWCVKDLLNAVQHVGLEASMRRKVVVEWANQASLEERALQTPTARRIFSFLMQGTKKLSLKKVVTSGRLTLPALMQRFASAPSNIAHASIALIPLMPPEDALLWLQHISAHQQPITYAHLQSINLNAMPASIAQEFLGLWREHAAAHPAALKEQAWHDEVASLLPLTSENVFAKTCQWLVADGSAQTLRMFQKLQHRYGLSASKHSALKLSLNAIMQRLGNAGSLSLVSDSHAGGLSVSGEAQQGDVSFVFDEVDQASAQKEYK